MPVIVDTNIILDVITDDPNWADWSIDILENYSSDGLIVNSAIYAELSFGIETISDVDNLIRNFGLLYKDVPRLGLFKAAKAFREYKKRKGSKDFVLPDFFIGGHAEAIGVAIITRDVNRYKTYFPNVQIIHP